MEEGLRIPGANQASWPPVPEGRGGGGSIVQSQIRSGPPNAPFHIPAASREPAATPGSNPEKMAYGALELLCYPALSRRGAIWFFRRRLKITSAYIRMIGSYWSAQMNPIAIEFYFTHLQYLQVCSIYVFWIFSRTAGVHQVATQFDIILGDDIVRVFPRKTSGSLDGPGR